MMPIPRQRGVGLMNAISSVQQHPRHVDDRERRPVQRAQHGGSDQEATEQPVEGTCATHDAASGLSDGCGRG